MILKKQIETLVLNISTGKTKSGLQSVTLHVPVLSFEPHAVGADGKPVSADATITMNEANAIVDALTESHFFETAEKYYSERTTVDIKRFPPPENAIDYKNRIPRKTTQEFIVRVSTFDEHWYTYYESGLSSGSINEINKLLNKEAEKLVSQLKEK